MIKQETMFSDTADEVNSHGPDETELEKLRAVKRSIFTEMAAAERTRSSAMENYCRKGNLIKENHLEVEYHEFMRARQRAEREENDKEMGAGRTGTGEGAEDVL